MALPRSDSFFSLSAGEKGAGEEAGRQLMIMDVVVRFVERESVLRKKEEEDEKQESPREKRSGPAYVIRSDSGSSRWDSRVFPGNPDLTK